MHGYEPGTVTPTTARVLTHQHPSDRSAMSDLIEQMRRHGAPFTSRQRIFDARGEEHLVIVVADRFYEGGTPAGAAGFYVDITQQFKAAVQERLSKAVHTVSARRAMIDQAIGMLMLRYGLTAERSAIRDDMAAHIDALLGNLTENTNKYTG